MKADYKNWMPKGMVASFIGGSSRIVDRRLWLQAP